LREQNIPQQKPSVGEGEGSENDQRLDEGKLLLMLLVMWSVIVVGLKQAFVDYPAI